MEIQRSAITEPQKVVHIEVMLVVRSLYLSIYFKCNFFERCESASLQKKIPTNEIKEVNLCGFFSLHSGISKMREKGTDAT